MRFKRSMEHGTGCRCLRVVKPYRLLSTVFRGRHFRSLVEAVQRRGVHVTVVSTLSMIADELRRQADVFTDLVELKSKIGRPVPQPRQG